MGAIVSYKEFNNRVQLPDVRIWRFKTNEFSAFHSVQALLNFKTVPIKHLAEHVKYPNEVFEQYGPIYLEATTIRRFVQKIQWPAIPIEIGGFR